MLTIREIDSTDPATISAAFAAQAWHKPASQYEAYFRAQLTGERVVLVAEWEGEFAGYVTIVWESTYPPFREGNVPEIVDFNVLEKYQRRGIGTALMDEAERRIGARSRMAGIGVGLLHDYGKAQVMYVRRGYIPDGRGVFAQGRWLNHGDMIVLDDDAALFFIKKVILSKEEEQTQIIRQTLTTDHALNRLLALMRHSGQSALYLTGTRLDSDYGFVTDDVGILFSVLPEDAEKAAVPGYHPGSAETYIPFQGELVLEFLIDGRVKERRMGQNDVHTFPPGQCHRVRADRKQQAISVIIKTRLDVKPGVVRCEDCKYYPDKVACPLYQNYSKEI